MVVSPLARADSEVVFGFEGDEASVKGGFGKNQALQRNEAAGRSAAVQMPSTPL